ncbi:MAG: DUF4388 domain-containing protein [Thermomicrobiales bacterium]|nr:DUF4388 domain-containing protein [Thermomicrobiales bacterium]
MTTHHFETDDWMRPSSAPRGESERFQSASFVRGVSLSGVLQMLHLERKTCVLEVVADGEFGTLTLVNGELVDAGAGEIDGEEAVYRILSWPHPRTTILDGVNLFRHSVGLPIPRLLVELVRRQDESAPAPAGPLASSEGPADRPATSPESARDWDRLVEAMVISGALGAAVLDAETESLLALADEFGGRLDGLSAAALTELVPATKGLLTWLRTADADELIARINGLHVLIQPLDDERVRFAYALLESTGGIERVRSACRLNTAV